MTNRWRSILLLCIFSVLPITASAKKFPMEKYVSDVRVDKFLQLAIKNIHRGRCGKEHCKPATKAEFKKTPVTKSHARKAMKSGIVSGIMQWCNLNWQKRSFAPLIIYHKRAAKMSDRQLSLMAILHGTQQAIVHRSLSSGKKCAKKVRKNLHGQMPGKNMDTLSP